NHHHGGLRGSFSSDDRGSNSWGAADEHGGWSFLAFLRPQLPCGSWNRGASRAKHRSPGSADSNTDNFSKSSPPETSPPEFASTASESFNRPSAPSSSWPFVSSDRFPFQPWAWPRRHRGISQAKLSPLCSSPSLYRSFFFAIEETGNCAAS